MVTETVETPSAEPQVDPETPVQEAQTETPVESESAAEPTAESAATEIPQVEVTEEKPEYMTRADWEREKAEVAQRAAADALELDRRRRQTENARKARAEADAQAAHQEAIDTLKASLGARGIYEVPDDAATAAITRIASKQAERMSANALDTVEQAWDYLTAPAYGKQVDLDAESEEAAKRLGPKLQHLVDQIKPALYEEARKGYIAESDLQARYDAMDAARNAKSREGKEELKRVEGQPSTNNNTLEAWEQRVAHQGEDGYPHLSPSDWDQYKAVRTANGL